ncbi:unnamed protein product [Cyclocybe aegerita]|uniref:Uncharacterized protein n=1 Tax=Cyclocybe aegerita TaxID=1973307 RepID=A0A8S0W3R9_CYCAE|nr:unnamed protein product [Cyclocybe aegerita]
MSPAFTPLPRTSETLFGHGSEGIGLAPMEDTAPTNPREFYQTHEIFLAYLLVPFTIALAICSIKAEADDTNGWMRWSIPFRTPDIAAFFATPLTLFYLIAAIISSHRQAKFSPNLSPSVFGRIHVVCTSVLAFLWWMSALDNVERIGDVHRTRIRELGFNRLRARIAILAAIQTVFLLLICVSFLHQMWKRQHESGNGYIGLRIHMPRMVNDTAYIDFSRSSVVNKLRMASNLQVHEEGAEESVADDTEKLLNSRASREVDST